MQLPFVPQSVAANMCDATEVAVYSAAGIQNKKDRQGKQPLILLSRETAYSPPPGFTNPNFASKLNVA